MNLRFYTIIFYPSLQLLRTSLVGAPRVELGLSAPKADVLPSYSAPACGFIYIIFACFPQGMIYYINDIPRVFVENECWRRMQKIQHSFIAMSPVPVFRHGD